MRKLVIYVGGFGFPARTASALRAFGNAEGLRRAGYDVILAGKFADIPEPSSPPATIHGFSCYDIRRPLPETYKVDYTVSAANVEALLRHVGADRIAAIMAYNYPALGLRSVLRMAKRLEIPVIVESTEWYGWEGFRPLSNVRRILSSYSRNNGLVERAGNFLCATRWSRDRHPGSNSLVLPFALDPGQDQWGGPANTSWCGLGDQLRLVYSGSPGLGMHKDRLPLIVEGLDAVDPTGQRFRFAIVGISRHEYLRMVPNHVALIQRHAHSIQFLGRLPHRDAVAALKAADFSVFVRRRTRVSRVGFPTKYAEAATLGVPVLTNDTSDIAVYLVDGVNGILVPDCTAESVRAGLARALAMPRAALAEMRTHAAREQRFTPSAWVPEWRRFMSALRLPR